VAETIEILTAPTHGEMARLSGLQNAEIVAPPKMVTNPSTNRGLDVYNFVDVTNAVTTKNKNYTHAALF